MSFFKKLGELTAGVKGIFSKKNKPGPSSAPSQAPDEDLQVFMVRRRIPATWFTKAKTAGVLRSMCLAWQSFLPEDKVIALDKGWVTEAQVSALEARTLHMSQRDAWLKYSRKTTDILVSLARGNKPPTGGFFKTLFTRKDTNAS